MIADDEILRIEQLHASYMGRSTELKVVDGLDLSIRRGEIIGIAGESGSGKTTLVLAVLRLLRPPGRIQAGRVWFRPDPRREPIDLLAVDDGALRQLRWATFSYIPQGSMNVLNPVATVGRQMCDHKLHVRVLAGIGQSPTGTNGSSGLKRICSALVGFDPPHSTPTMR